MKNAIVKDSYRDIKKSLGRFIAIASIVTLGVAVFSGLKVAPIYMKTSVDKYYDEYNLMDIRVLSTLGLTDGDIKAIKEIEGVDAVYPTYSSDVITNYNSEDIVIRVHGIPLDKINSNEYMNRLNLKEGRLPEKSGEVVIDNNSFNGANIKIGTKLQLSTGTDTPINEFLAVDEVTVVGIVESPYYISVEKGSSNIGNGTVRVFMMISQEDFNMKVYSEAFVTVQGAKSENSFDNSYFEIVNKVKDKIEGISSDRIDVRYNEILGDATSELNKGKDEYENEKSKAEEELQSAEEKIEKNKNDLLMAQKELDSKRLEFSNNTKNAEAEIEKGKTNLAQGEAEYNKALQAFNEEKPKALESIKTAEANLEIAKKNIDGLKAELSGVEQALKNPNLSVEERSKLEAKQKILIDEIASATNKYNLAQNQLIEKKKTLEATEKKLEDTRKSLESQKTILISKSTELEKSKKDGELQFSKKQDEINKGNELLASGIKEYEDNKKTAEDKLLDAENYIKLGEDKLSKIARPEWHVLNRKSHLSYVDYENAANNIKSLSNIFPVIFFLVAALVCLTTMTRMVDEQRGNIGTLKALGYSKAVIASKFIAYAFIATLIGSLIGLWVGFLRIPAIIYNTQRVRFILPELALSFNIPIALGITLVAIAITTIAAFSACNVELIENPSNLMRPKAPKEGKRILFERIPFIWNKLSFIGKVTVRNIFRYKKRFIMTVVGIAGCTGLLLTGFGIKDSIKSIVEKQYESIFKYDMTINLNKDITEGELKYLERKLPLSKEIVKYDFVNNENCKILSDEGEKDLTLVVPKNLQSFSELISLHDAKTKEKLNLENNGAIISEKIAESINVKVGDIIEVTHSNDIKYKVKISGITENYILNYMYMSPSYYKEVFNEEGKFNSILAETITLNKSLENDLANNLTMVDGINGVSFNSTMIDSFNNVVKSLDNVVRLMIVVAGLLAFVVLYNLTNVNISERMREVATIKVLGFYDNEVSSYIYRENIILTFVGALVGLGFGVVTHAFIMSSIEMNNLMMLNSINLLSYIIAVILTVVFSIVVNCAMYYKLKNIDMIESLKSVD